MKSNGKSFKIVSRFYVIYGDGVPIYVGYTNRAVRQRFKEHREEKDFSDFSDIKSVELKDENLSFDFTWDYNETCKNADLVSKREGQLIDKYHTQDSIFQKADGGGQAWAFERGFVKTNKGNPRFTGMSGAEIKARIEKEKIISTDIHSFVNHMIPQYQTDISDFIKNMKPQYQTDISDFIKNMKPQYQVDISDFINHMKPQYQVDISHFISNMKPQYQVDIKNFINNLKPSHQVDISNFINSMNGEKNKMNNISVTFKKNKNNKYLFKAEQNGKILFKKEYIAGRDYDDTDLVDNQAHGFSAYVEYIQDRIDAELKADPNFVFDNLEQFKKFAGAKMQKEFYSVQKKYFEKYCKQL